MCSKSKALNVAAKFGFVLDESVSGLVGGCYMVTFDHPTHSISGDCRSIHVCDYGSSRPGDTPARAAWTDAIQRMQDEGPFLEPCSDPDCEYHT